MAAGLCFASIGSDTGGSIRIPVALCGIVGGLKPTFGLVSCHGVVPLSSSLDHTGPLARTVADVVILLSVIAERRAKTSRTRKGRLRLGMPREYFWEKLNDEVRHLVEIAAWSLEREGFTIEEVSLPQLHESIEPSTQTALAEARHFHETAGYFPARAADYSEEVRMRLELGG